MKKVMVQFSIQGMTAEQYDRAWRELLNADQISPTGLLYHVCGQQADNWVVFELWQSEKAFNKFNETLLTVLGNLGIDIAGINQVLTPVYYEHEGADLVVAF